MALRNTAEDLQRLNVFGPLPTATPPSCRQGAQALEDAFLHVTGKARLWGQLTSGLGCHRVPQGARTDCAVQFAEDSISVDRGGAQEKHRYRVPIST